MYVVYKHTTPSNKVYIGITCRCPKERWGGGSKYRDNDHFNRAIKKYGWKNIKHEIVKSNLTKEEACQLEIKLIAQYNATNPNFGYNISTGGENGHTGTHHSAETIERIRKSNLGQKRSEIARKHMSEAHKGICVNKGHLVSEETKLKISRAHMGKSLSEEHKRKISEALKHIQHKTGFHLSDEHRRNVSKALKGKPHSAEHNKKVSEAKRGKKHNEISRKHMSEAHLGKLHSEEQKKKMSESTKKYWKNLTDTQKQSIIQCRKNALCKSDVGVLLYNQNEVLIKQFKTSAECARYLGVSPALVCKKLKHSPAYIQEYRIEKLNGNRG